MWTFSNAGEIAAAGRGGWLSGRGTHLRLKRCLDVSVALVALIVAAPVLIAAAIAIRLTSPGPALFRQRRCGRAGRPFTMYKLRTMRLGTPSPLPADGALIKYRDDPRVTRIGALLRRTSIDELPQLFNVLRGDMSLVGPRPLMPHMLEPFPDFCAVRSLVPPGITGLWQIRDREHSTSARFMMPHDLEYIATLSIGRDIRILMATVAVVVAKRGSY
jgi:lipopolysaccharide/colanic/teichoic acid biosynthesis glycosyltransferase